MLNDDSTRTTLQNIYSNGEESEYIIIPLRKLLYIYMCLHLGFDKVSLLSSKL